MALCVAGCALDSLPVGTPGGFGNGDPQTIPAFREAIAGGRGVRKETLPNVGGGNAELIRALLSPPVATGGERQSDADARKLRHAVLEALDRPSAKPARLFYIARAFAFEDRDTPVVLLICDACGTASLAMRAAGKDDVLLSPQFDLSALGSPVTP